MVRVNPPPLTVMVAVRTDVDVLAVAVTVTVTATVPSLEPTVGETVSQDSLLEIDQFVLDVMVNGFCSPAVINLNESVETVKEVGISAACVAVMVCSATPDTLLLTVIVAVRESVFVLATTVADTVSLFDPDDEETVSHEASLLTVHLSLEVMENVFCSPEGV